MPLVWGGLAALGFYALIHQGVLAHEMVDRYFASHPVEYITMTLFFIGLAALAGKTVEVAIQKTGLDGPLLGAAPAEGNRVSEVDSLLGRLAETPDHLGDSYLIRRVREALEFVRRKGQADSLDEHLRYAADLDADRKHSGYSLVRIIIWAIPILGFLGTVIGITLAIAQLGLDVENSMPKVILGLKVAFDTTALALALSIVLMFAQYAVDRYESQLLAAVDARVEQELTGRFQQLGAANDPQAASIRQMSEAVVESCHRLVERQAELWQSSIEAAHDQWSGAARDTGTALQKSLAGALNESLQHHVAALAEIEKQAASDNRLHWQQVQTTLSQSTQAVTRQHKDLIQQGEMLLKVTDATDRIGGLEDTLNENLRALAGAANFEETVMSLSAAIQLLTAQLRSGHGDGSRVDLKAGEETKTPKAA
jgi:biopolymer transport protein ExbB/TolQ